MLELERRKAARTKLQAFVEFTTPRWTAGRMHKRICEVFDDVIAIPDLDRVLICCPPQHGKSTISSKRFPAYYLGKRPELEIISASATDELVDEFGREVRDCISSPEYGLLFPKTNLAEDSQARGRWHTSDGGGYYAVGVGGALFGRGGELGLIDDPFRTWEQAQSENERKKVISWYQGTFYNRIRPGGKIVIIAHRTSGDDLGGFVLSEMAKGGDQWTVIELPAHLDDPPWPERYDRKALERLKIGHTAQQWQSLYMQQPTPDDGTYFKRDWFWRYRVEDVPKGAHIFASGDFAVTNDGGDFTDLGVHAYHGDKVYACYDWWHGQKDSAVWIEKLCNLFRRTRPFCFFGESGQIKKAIEPFLIQQMRATKAYCRLEWLPSVTEKTARARSLQAMAQMGLIGIPYGDEGERILRALLLFPNGKPDDPVDALGLFARAIHEAHPGITEEPDEDEPVDGYEDVQKEEVQEWRVV